MKKLILMGLALFALVAVAQTSSSKLFLYFMAPGDTAWRWQRLALDPATLSIQPDGAGGYKLVANTALPTTPCYGLADEVTITCSTGGKLALKAPPTTASNLHFGNGLNTTANADGSISISTNPGLIPNWFKQDGPPLNPPSPPCVDGRDWDADTLNHQFYMCAGGLWTIPGAPLTARLIQRP